MIPAQRATVMITLDVVPMANVQSKEEEELLVQGYSIPPLQRGWHLNSLHTDLIDP